MEKSKEIYWLCTDTLKMKNDTIRFISGKKYKQVRINEDLLVLINEQGIEHNLSGYWETQFERTPIN